jgi:cardiolipin synthase (CMP-forming)
MSGVAMGAQQPQVSDRIATVPNAISGFRLLTIPVFAWLALVPQADGWAALVLMVGGFSDYIDGVLARRWGQVTRLGQALDPIADRLATVTVLVVFLIRDIVPVWFVVLLVARDVVLSVQMGRLRRHGVWGLPVTWVGKAATFNLMASFPLLLWGAGAQSGVELLARVSGAAFALWGAGLYLYSGVLYLRQAREFLAGVPATAGA